MDLTENDINQITKISIKDLRLPTYLTQYIKCVYEKCSKTFND